MYTTNSTGLRHCTRGLSLVKLSATAGPSSEGSNMDSFFERHDMPAKCIVSSTATGAR